MACCIWPFNCCRNDGSISRFEKLSNGGQPYSRSGTDDEKSKHSNDDSEYSSMEDYQDTSEKTSNPWHAATWDTDYMDMRQRGIAINTQPMTISTTAQALQPDSDEYYEENGVSSNYSAHLFPQPSKVDGPANENSVYKEVAKSTLTSSRARKSSSDEQENESSQWEKFTKNPIGYIQENIAFELDYQDSDGVFENDAATDSSRDMVITPDYDGSSAHYSEDESWYKRNSRKKLFETDSSGPVTPKIKIDPFKKLSEPMVASNRTDSPRASTKYPTLKSQFAKNQANLMERGARLKNIEKNMINLEDMCKTFGKTAHAAAHGKKLHESKEPKDPAPARLAVGSIKIRKASRTSEELFKPFYDKMAEEADSNRYDSDSSDAEKKFVPTLPKFIEADEAEDIPTGKVVVRLKYDESSGKLGVHMQKAGELPLKENRETYDTLAELVILPQDKEPQLSGVIRDSREPLYDELFTFFLRDLQMKTLRISILERGRQNQDDAIGHALFYLDNCDPEETFSSFSAPLSIKSQPGEPTALALVRIVYQVAKEKLIVEVLQARNISILSHKAKLPKLFDSCDTYAKVTLRSGGEKVKSKRSAVEPRSTDPSYKFNAQFLVPESLLNGASVVVSIMLKGRIKKSVRVGKTNIGPYHFIRGNEPTIWRRIVHGKETITQWFPLYM